MSKIEMHLIELITQNKSLNEICDILNLSHRQLYKHILNLKNNGYTLTRNYYYDGNIFYQKINDSFNQSVNTITINMNDDQNKFRAIVISDQHVGCDKQRLDLINQIYDYCIKNNINIILNTGDLVDGWLGPNKKINKDIEHQLTYLLNRYPFDRNILNFICLGNHDINPVKNFGINLKTILENYRHDLIAFTSGKGQINIKSDQIVMCHQLEHKVHNSGNFKNSIILEGHHHKFTTSFNHNLKNNLIFVPSLSNIYTDKTIQMPSALVMELDLEHEYFTHGVVSQLISDGKKFIKINEIRLLNLHNKNMHKKKNTAQNISPQSTIQNTVNNENLEQVSTTVNDENSTNPKVHSKSNDFERMLADFKEKDKLQRRYEYE